MSKVLITGGAGFFGGILQRRLLDDGFDCVCVDLVGDACRHRRLKSIRGDVRDVAAMDELFATHKFDAVFHCAAMLAHAVSDKDMLWTSNVNGTRTIAEAAKKHNVPKVVFISSNCLWATNFHRPVTEEDVPKPAELYGMSKWEGEKILLEYTNHFDCTVIRTPTIIDSGRLGLLAILFQFIDEGRKVWLVGDGGNRYQFIYAPDLAEACVRAINHDRSDIFNVGSDDVQSLREVFQYVIDAAGASARVASLPKAITLWAMKAAHKLGISPLGPYHYKMICEDFAFDTTKIASALNWRPTLTNGEMLFKAYEYYHHNLDAINSADDVSAHKQPAKMGVIKLLKWLS